MTAWERSIAIAEKEIMLGDVVRVDFTANAASLGAWAVRARTGAELKAALADARKQPRVVGRSDRNGL